MGDLGRETSSEVRPGKRHQNVPRSLSAVLSENHFPSSLLTSISAQLLMSSLNSSPLPTCSPQVLLGLWPDSLRPGHHHYV